MKQVKLKIPVGKADAFATYAFSNSIRVILSWSKDEFFGGHVMTIIAIEDEKLPALQSSEFGKMIQ